VASERNADLRDKAQKVSPHLLFNSKRLFGEGHVVSLAGACMRARQRVVCLNRLRATCCFCCCVPCTYQILQKSQQMARNEFDLDYDERNPFVIGECPRSLAYPHDNFAAKPDKVSASLSLPADVQHLPDRWAPACLAIVHRRLCPPAAHLPRSPISQVPLLRIQLHARRRQDRLPDLWRFSRRR
jgi:hypothetical protein